MDARLCGDDDKGGNRPLAVVPASWLTRLMPDTRITIADGKERFSKKLREIVKHKPVTEKLV